MNLDDRYSKSFAEWYVCYKAAFNRYKHLALSPAVAVVILTLIFAVIPRSYYISDVSIVVEPRKVTSKILREQDKYERQDRLEALVQAVLARPQLRAILDRFDLYPDYQGPAAKETALKKFQQAITVRPKLTISGRPANEVFTVNYWHYEPQKAYEVTKEIASLFIEESLIYQRSEAQGTEEFLDAQLREARKRLEQTEALVQEFVKNSVGKLPTDRDQVAVRLTHAQSQLSTNNQLIAANSARIGYLQNEYKITTKELSTVSEDSLGANQSLEQLERMLVVLKGRYSDKHPDVLSLQKRIEALQAAENANVTGSTPKNMGRTTSEARSLRREVGQLTVQNEALKEENKRLEQEIAQLADDIKEMPIKEQELIKINRDYANVKQNYQALLAAKEEAAIQSSLVRSQKSSSFRIIEPPIVPIKPAGPHRILILSGGVFAAIVLYFLVPILMLLLSSAYLSPEEPEDELDVQVIGVVPPMRTQEAVFSKVKGAKISLLLSSLVVLIGVLITVFVFY